MERDGGWARLRAVDELIYLPRPPDNHPPPPPSTHTFCAAPQPFDQPGIPLWTLRPALTDAQYANASAIETWIQPWPDEAAGTCVLNVPAQGPVPVADRLEWLVLAYGVELGPFSINHLAEGTVPYTDPILGVVSSISIRPTTLVGRINTTEVLETINYGLTSADATLAAQWAARVAALPIVVQTPAGAGVPNEVVIVETHTALWGGEYLPLSGYPGLESLVYPSCSGVTFRGEGTRRHGRKTNANWLGLILSANLTAAGMANLSAVVNATDQLWNPADEWIDDVVTNSFDVATCVCSTDWAFVGTEVPAPPRFMQLLRLAGEM